jgi:hypothetical protein
MPHLGILCRQKYRHDYLPNNDRQWWQDSLIFLLSILSKRRRRRSVDLCNPAVDNTPGYS